MMNGKKQKSKKTNLQSKDESPNSGDSDSGAEKEEFPGIHIIGEEDAQRHFGASEIKPGNRKSGQMPERRQPKAKVRLELDEEIWRRAQEAAEKMKTEPSRYVEMALEQFMKDA